MAKSANRLHRVGGFKGVDVDENTLVDSADADLVAQRKAMKEYNDQVQKDSDMSLMTPELQSLMRHMHSYATRYNVDLYRSMKENGGKQSCDGQGAMAKTKFTSVLIGAFSRSARRAHRLRASTSSTPHALRRHRTAPTPMQPSALVRACSVAHVQGASADGDLRPLRHGAKGARGGGGEEEQGGRVRGPPRSPVAQGGAGQRDSYGGQVG